MLITCKDDSSLPHTIGHKSESFMKKSRRVLCGDFTKTLQPEQRPCLATQAAPCVLQPDCIALLLPSVQAAGPAHHSVPHPTSSPLPACTNRISV